MYSKALEKGNLLHFWEDGLRERTVFFCPCSQPLQDGRKVLSVMPALGGGVHFTKGYLLHCEKLSFIVQKVIFRKLKDNLLQTL